jgi:hypothetical protein
MRRKPDRQIAAQLNLYGSAVNVRFQNPATPQPLRPLRFQKRTFTAPIITQFDTFNRMLNGDGFLKLKTGTFWIDTIPLMKSRLAFQLATWLAFGEARHEAAKLALGWQIRKQSVSQTRSRRLASRAASRVASGKAAGQLPRIVRAVAGKHLTQQR